MATQEQIQQRIDDAKEQLHKVATGRQARVYVDQNGERVEYTAANVTRLEAYINGLEMSLKSRRVIGPMRVWLR